MCDGRGQLPSPRAGPQHPALTSHGLPAPADLLQIVIVIVNDVPKAVHRPLRFLQLREEDSLRTHQRGAAAPQRGAGRGGGSAPTWDSSSSSSSKVKARNLELCQYSSSSARALLICNDTTRPQRRPRPVPSRPAKRSPSPPLTSPRSSPTPGSGSAAARHRGKGGRRAGHAGTAVRPLAAFRPAPRRSRTATPGAHCAGSESLLGVAVWQRGSGRPRERERLREPRVRAGAPGGTEKLGRGGRGRRRKGPCRCRKPGGGAGRRF